MAVTVFAPAKINLSLHVGRARADGRHPLESVVVFADVGDVLHIEEGPNALDVTGPFAADLEGENLITRALALLGVSARVTLEKNLPVASGIGGGSADAAAAMIGVNELLKLGFDRATLAEKGAALGADLPACVRGKPAFMTGTGETLTDASVPDLHAVLVNPGVALSTGAVYRKFDEQGGDAELSNENPRWRNRDEAIAALVQMRNDLETPACALAPIIGYVRARLSQDSNVLLARMSGSGATCFALVDNHDNAMNLAGVLQDEHASWWIRAARLGAVDVTTYSL